MKRMKRFILVQSDEKDTIWKSSDNLLAGIARMNSEKGEDDASSSSTIDEPLMMATLTVPSPSLT